MRRRLALAGAWLLSACAAAGPGLRLPDSRLELSREPPPLPGPPAEGPFDAAASRDVTLLVASEGESARVRAWCRVGVWTTLDQVRGRTFVTRESWGRLGGRPPRLLARIKDQALDGVVARVRPEEDGTLSFVVEIGETDLEPSHLVDIYAGQRVLLGHPVRRGYRFRGTAPAQWTGTVARWGTVAVHLGGEGAGTPPGALVFAVGEEEGFVAGPRPAAEAFREEWTPLDPFRYEADGVERMDYRLEKCREAAGFSVDEAGAAVAYGPAFAFRRHG